MNKHKLSDKYEALTLIQTLAFTLKDQILQYVPALVNLCADLITFYYHDGIKLSSYTILEYLLSASKGNRKVMLDSYVVIYKAIVGTWGTDNDLETTAHGYLTLARVYFLLI